jgi:2-C-methyl-D-erythritol 2,4-cyclodiphosphate synthase
MAEAVGLGLDLHRSDPSRTLVLAGVRFDGEPGLAGHSDGDVVCHAVADALLGAAALGDLGDHFPDDDPAFAGVEGPTLLARALEVAAIRGRVRPVHVDVTVIAERPRLAGRRDELRARLAEVLDLGIDRVSVKATRPEGLGLSGEGMGCLAVVLVR